ncbi:hypothetical protein SCLCIDRAFT_1215257 [Scleroderma citrinum Foug A]|uniref:Uncharacterized protein n=1 Tax=Scleroderma citrinum Foug A TaxID=1036808 RepID=A0A0C3DNG5_9AGAM|nr:hypothetical protein SCLCIDRAFT_1215257 [Scleroderma citrinum Foug A]
MAGAIEECTSRSKLMTAVTNHTEERQRRPYGCWCLKPWDKMRKPRERLLLVKGPWGN